MNTTTKKILGISLGTILALSIAIVVFFRVQPLNDNHIKATTEVVADKVEPVAAPPAEVSVPEIEWEAPDIIEEPTMPNIEDTLPPPSVVEEVAADGTVVQTPNWEAQKELPEDTKLDDPDQKPEYVNNSNNDSGYTAPPANNNGTTTPPANNAPNTGNQKEIDGQDYTYVEGFGWVKNGNGGGTNYIEAPTTGNKVGH